mmetsp:Transcript_6319/g.19796  ORF Transcript_6319/g.19796 Transcript_6319/m.19796 type:complete len:223 (+) Transcript_6319:1062-1730(+)
MRPLRGAQARRRVLRLSRRVRGPQSLHYLTARRLQGRAERSRTQLTGRHAGREERRPRTEAPAGRRRHGNGPLHQAHRRRPRRGPGPRRPPVPLPRRRQGLRGHPPHPRPQLRRQDRPRPHPAQGQAPAFQHLGPRRHHRRTPRHGVCLPPRRRLGPLRRQGPDDQNRHRSRLPHPPHRRRRLRPLQEQEIRVAVVRPRRESPLPSFLPSFLLRGRSSELSR